MERSLASRNLHCYFYPLKYVSHYRWGTANLSSGQAQNTNHVKSKVSSAPNWSTSYEWNQISYGALQNEMTGQMFRDPLVRRTYVLTPWNLTFLQLTYLLTAWCRVLLEKLTALQLVKKFPAFHGTRRFITALPSVRHLSLSWASPIQSIYLHPTSWRSVLILFPHLRLGLSSGLLRSGFPTNTLYTPSPHPYVPRAQPISFFSILSPAQYWVWSTIHLAPRYAISSIPPLPRPS